MGFLIDTLVLWVVRTLKKWNRETLEREALDWPRTLGTVVGAQTKRSDEGDSRWNTWRVELTYSYAAAGEYYSGTHLLPPGIGGRGCRRRATLEGSRSSGPIFPPRRFEVCRADARSNSGRNIGPET